MKLEVLNQLYQKTLLEYQKETLEELRELLGLSSNTNMEEIATKEKFYTLADFGKVCERMKLPFFVVEKTINPFNKVEKETIKNKIYENYSEFRETMPSWSAREYDYENDCVSGYYGIDGVENGFFKVNASNNHTTYEWSFIVTDKAVMVHSICVFTD